MFKRSSRLLSGSANALIITENNAKDGVFDPTITTSVSCSVFWECSNGYREVTTGTSHALSYTAPDSSPRRWVVRCAAGLGAITVINIDSDNVTEIRNLQKCRELTQLSSYTTNTPIPISSIRGLSKIVRLNGKYSGSVDDLACKGVLTGSDIGSSGSVLSGSLAGFTSMSAIFTACGTSISGSLSDLVPTNTTVHLYSNSNILPASIAHLTAIRDLRIYSMGWSAAATGIDIVVDSVYAARAAYTYASGIVLRYGGTDAIPSGTEGTTPPADGVSNADWTWNAGTSQHEPQTPQAKMFIMQNDPYGEGFKGWTFTKV